MVVDNMQDSVSFPQQAAKASWMIFILIIFISVFGHKVAMLKVITELLIMLLSVTATILGIIALCNIPRYGTKKILFPAVVGIILNSFLILIFITNLISSYYRNR